MSPPDRFIGALEVSQALHLFVAPRSPAAAHQKGAPYPAIEFNGLAHPGSDPEFLRGQMESPLAVTHHPSHKHTHDHGNADANKSKS